VSDDRKDIYRQGRLALKHLREGREFIDWLNWARAYDEARREAMQRAGTNSPVGAHYNEQFAKVMAREKLVERTGPEKHQQFPDPETRSFAMRMLENYDFPAEDPRRKAIKVWRSELYAKDPQKYGQLNHPKRVVQRWLEDTMPQAEKQAREEARKWRAAEKAAAPDPIAEDLANEEGRHRDTRRELEDLRELLGLILGELESGTVSEATVERIRAMLRGEEGRQGE